MVPLLNFPFKCCIHDLIHTDQSGFLKGRNIGHNIRLILDIIEYTDSNDIPGSILLIDIEKAFDGYSPIDRGSDRPIIVFEVHKL